MIEVISQLNKSSQGGGGTPIVQQYNNYIWLSGQSNMDGRAAAASFPSELQDPVTLDGKSAFMRDYINNPTTWEVLEAGVNTSDNPGQAGAQPKLAFDLLTLLEADLYFLQVAEGGKTIANWLPGTDYYNYIESQTNAIKAADQKAKFEYFIWIQGESNGGGGYDSALRNLIARLRNTINKDLIFIIVQMIDCQTGVSNLATLQTEQADVASDSVLNELIAKGGVADGCADTLHFDLTKYLDVSDKCYDILKDMKQT